MTRIRQFVSCYLALCLAGGGAVAISPVLHRLIEHGGYGPAHTHSDLALRLAIRQHLRQHEHGHSHSHNHDSPPLCRPRLFEHSFEPFGLPKLSLARVWHALHHFFEAATLPESSPPERGPGHEHHSLFQLLASGLVDQPLAEPLLPTILTTFAASEFPAHTH